MPVVRGCTIKIVNSDLLSAHIDSMKNQIALSSLIGVISILVVDLLVCCEA
jgi:hypothetical protein